MAGERAGVAGGIAGLVELILEHGEAVEYDLIALGLRLDWLGTDRLSWRDLWVIAQQAPRRSAIGRAMLGEDAGWGLSEMLLAALLDEARWDNWSKTKDGAKGRNQPKPTPRPGVRPDHEKYGSDGIPIDEMADWLGWDQQEAKRSP